MWSKFNLPVTLHNWEKPFVHGILGQPSLSEKRQKRRVNKNRLNFQCLKTKNYLTESPLDQELFPVALHLCMTRASDVWCLLVPGHSPALSSSTWKFSAIDSMTLIFLLLQSSGTSGCVVVVVANNKSVVIMFTENNIPCSKKFKIKNTLYVFTINDRT